MIRKIHDIPRPCTHPEHDPPSMIVLEPGVYEHTCPSCGRKIEFSVPGTYCDSSIRNDVLRTYELQKGPNEPDYRLMSGTLGNPVTYLGNPVT